MSKKIDAESILTNLKQKADHYINSSWRSWYKEKTSAEAIKAIHLSQTDNLATLKGTLITIFKALKTSSGPLYDSLRVAIWALAKLQNTASAFQDCVKAEAEKYRKDHPKPNFFHSSHPLLDALQGIPDDKVSSLTITAYLKVLSDIYQQYPTLGSGIAGRIVTQAFKTYYGEKEFLSLRRRVAPDDTEVQGNAAEFHMNQYAMRQLLAQPTEMMPINPAPK